MVWITSVGKSESQCTLSKALSQNINNHLKTKTERRYKKKVERLAMRDALFILIRGGEQEVVMP
jgi:hypothetical protein